jgi:hypothetical protein
MQQPRRWRAIDPANLYVAVGLLLLLGSLWVPWLTAQRTARVERRADELAELLLEVAEPFAPPVEPQLREYLLARLQKLATCRGVLVGDLEEVDPPSPGASWTLQNKHYLFSLQPSPPEPNLLVGRDTVPAFEVVAWPREQIGPGHCAFFHPAGAPRAFTRNLAADYHGLGQAPKPGASHRLARSSDHPAAYRGADDERWLVY